MYSIDQICTIIKGRWLQQSNAASIEYLLTDSRTVGFPAVSVFFALKGLRRNGHAFLSEGYGNGLRNFVVADETTDLPKDANIIIVKDTLLALQQLAAFHRKQFSFPVIGITGSNGKTIVKEWLNQLLEEQYVIARSPKSYNSQLGVPLSVWQMNDQHTLGLFEAGISQFGEMDKLEKVIQPTIGIFTNIGEAHSEGFLNLRQKVKEKLQLFKHVQTLVYCSDYPEINEGVAELVQLVRNIPGNKINLFSWSNKTTATLRVVSMRKAELSTHITVLYNGVETAFTIPFTDDASVENAIACYCTLLHLGVDNRYIQERTAHLVPVAMRLELKKGINNCSIINDSYSADLSSLKIALDFLARQQQHSRKTIILSDIPESGKTEKDLYQLLAATLLKKQVDRFIGIGPQLLRHKKMFEATPGMQTVFYENTAAFKKDFYQLRFQSETILLKGARVFAFEQLLPLLEQKVHQTVLEINLSDVLHNLRQYQQVINPSTKIMAMVKAASYGSGTYEIASLLEFQRVDYLAVAYADEGIELRKGGIHLPIMVINPEANTFDALVQYKLEPAVYSLHLLALFTDYLVQEGLQQYPVHIELETGMNRLGFDVADMDMLANKLLAGHCRIQSVFTHLAASEDPASDDFTVLQSKKYFAAIDLLQNRLGYGFIRHIANSAAIVRHPHLQLDMVRLGIGLYGIDSAATQSVQLKEVSVLKTTIAQVKQVKKGDTIGYSRRGIAGNDLVIATVRLGYADGYPRRLSNGIGHMLVNGIRAPVIGTISMDMTMLDITHCGHAAEGDEVIVFGAGLSVRQLAEWAQTIPYEIMAGISQRVKRVYFEE